MSQSKLTQSVLLEVLVTEIESFKKTKEDYAKILTHTTGHLKRLEELYKKPINVDISAMQQEHKAILDTLRKAIYLPHWIVVIIISLLISLSVSLAFNYKHYKLKEDAKNYINYLERRMKK